MVEGVLSKASQKKVNNWRVVLASQYKQSYIYKSNLTIFVTTIFKNVVTYF